MANKKQATAFNEVGEKQFFGSYEDLPERRTVTSRAQLRDEVSDQVQAFLSRGGQIREVEPNVMADPPRKPSSNYGSKPL